MQYLREAPPIQRRNLLRSRKARDDNEGLIGGGFRNRGNIPSSSSYYSSYSSDFSSMRYDPDLRAIGEASNRNNHRTEKKVEKIPTESKFMLPFMKLIDFVLYPEVKIDIQLKLRVISSPIPFTWHAMLVVTVLNKVFPPGNFFHLSQVSYWSMLIICCVIAYFLGLLISYLLRASKRHAKLDLHQLSAWVVRILAGLAAMFHNAFEFDGEFFFAFAPFVTFFVCMYFFTTLEVVGDGDGEEAFTAFTRAQRLLWTLLWNFILYAAVTVVFYVAQQFFGMEVYHLTPTATFIVATYAAENVFGAAPSVITRASFMALVYTAFMLTVFESFFYFPMLSLALGSCLSVEDMKQKKKSAKREISDTLRIIREKLEEGNVSLSDVGKIFAAIDEDGNRVIDRSEFKSAMKKLEIPMDNDTLETIFLVFDNDENGIDYDEFLDIFSFEKEKRNEYYGGIVQDPEERLKALQRRRLVS